MLAPNVVRRRYVVEVEECVCLAGEGEESDRPFTPGVPLVEASTRPTAVPQGRRGHGHAGDLHIADADPLPPGV